MAAGNVNANGKRTVEFDMEAYVKFRRVGELQYDILAAVMSIGALPNMFSELARNVGLLAPEDKLTAEHMAAMARGLARASEQLPAATTRIAELEKQLGTEADSVKKLTAALSDIKNEVMKANQDTAKAQQDLATANKEKSVLTQQLTKANTDFAKVNLELTKANVELVKAKQELDIAKQDTTKAQLEATAARTKIAEMDTLCNQKDNEISRLNIKLHQMTTNHKDAVRDRDNMKKSCDRLKETADKAEEKAAGLERTNHEMVGVIAALKKKPTLIDLASDITTGYARNGFMQQ